MWRVNQTVRTQWRLGVGMSWLADSVDDTAGVNFALRTDYFPMKPLIFCGELDHGTLGHANTFHGRASVGFNIDQTEFFAGYDFRSIGDVDVEGPMLGVQFWYRLFTPSEDDKSSRAHLPTFAYSLASRWACSS